MTAPSGPGADVIALFPVEAVDRSVEYAPVEIIDEGDPLESIARNLKNLAGLVRCANQVGVEMSDVMSKITRGLERHAKAQNLCDPEGGAS